MFRLDQRRQFFSVLPHIGCWRVHKQDLDVVVNLLCLHHTHLIQSSHSSFTISFCSHQFSSKVMLICLFAFTLIEHIIYKINKVPCNQYPAEFWNPPKRVRKTYILKTHIISTLRELGFVIIIFSIYITKLNVTGDGEWTVLMTEIPDWVLTYLILKHTGGQKIENTKSLAILCLYYCLYDIYYRDLGRWVDLVIVCKPRKVADEEDSKGVTLVYLNTVIVGHVSRQPNHWAINRILLLWDWTKSRLFM